MTIQDDIDAIDDTKPVNFSATQKPSLKSVRDNFLAIKNALVGLLADKAALAANSFTGTQNLQDNVLQRPVIKDYAETVNAPAIAAGALTLDMETGNVFAVSHDANITTLTISHPPASGMAGSLTLHLTQDATGGRTLTFPSGCKFSGGIAPTLSTTASKRNKLVFDTIDGGTTWDVALVGKDFG